MNKPKIAPPIDKRREGCAGLHQTEPSVRLRSSTWSALTSGNKFSGRPGATTHSKIHEELRCRQPGETMTALAPQGWRRAARVAGRGGAAAAHRTCAPHREAPGDALLPDGNVVRAP